jgi:hypothetical protein
MQHPFICIVAGCTQSSKTVWVKSLLENAQTTISPTPQRIIWCYGQWQPSYFDMMRTMPGIEFNQGIPDDIDNADYLDVSQRNLMVDLKPTTDDQQRLNTNVLPGEIAKFLHKQSSRQSPLANAMYDAEQRMKEIMEAPKLSVVEKSKLYSDQLNRFPTFKFFEHHYIL